MKHRLGCIGFGLIGFAWLGFVFLDMFTASLGGDGTGRLGEVYRSMIFWRGLAGGLFIILAYLFFRAVTKDDDVR